MSLTSRLHFFWHPFILCDFPPSFPQRLFPFSPLSNVMIQLGVEFLTKHLLGPPKPLSESFILRDFGIDCNGKQTKAKKGREMHEIEE